MSSGDNLWEMLKHTSIYTVLNILTKVIGLSMIPVYTRYLSPEQYGTLELLELTTNFIEMFAGVGISFAVFKFYHKYGEGERERLISTSILATTGIFTFVGGLGILFSEQLAVLVFQNGAFSSYFQWIFIRFFAIGLVIIGLNYLRIIERTVLFSVLALLQVVVNLGLNIYFVVALEMGVQGVVVSSVIGQLCIGLPLAFLTLGRVGLHLDWDKFVVMLKYGSPFILTLLGQFLLNFADRFLLQRLSTLSDVGVYSLGYKFGFMLNYLFVSPFIMMWQPKMFEIEKKPNAPEVYSSVLTYFVLVMALGATLLSIFIKDALTLMADPAYHAGHAIVPFVAFAYLLNGVQFFFQLGMLLRGRTGYLGLNACAAGLISLLLYYFAIKWWGAMGAALATVMSYAVFALANYVLSQRLFVIKPEWKRLSIIAVATAATLAAGRCVELDGLAYTLIAKAGCMLLFPLLLFLCGFFRQDEQRWLLARFQH
jgi:O-antigen/teichoic acid export membrane protein